MIRLLLVDDQDRVLQALRMRIELEGDFEIVGEANSGREAVEQALALAPDAVVMDVEMPAMDGIEATRLLHEQNNQIPVIILSIFDDDQTRLRAMQAGATAFVAKRGGLDSLLGVIRRAVK